MRSARVPLGDRREVRADQPLDVVADRVGELGGVLDHEPGAAGERSPDPEGGGERVAALDRPVARAEEAEAARGPAVSMRWHESGQPFQPSSATASRSVMPGRRPWSSDRTPCEVWQAAHSKAASCSTSLITRRPSAASMRRSVAFSTEPPAPTSARSSSTRYAGTSLIPGPRRSSSRRRRRGCPGRSLPRRGSRPAAAIGRAAGSAG